ncbi:MAG: LytTR family DNA-binding domain-containing protein [Bacteroidales bacterium]|nr:LytTR family DNA-binding domain-containing protein [Bacteroidales bacterium]
MKLKCLIIDDEPLAHEVLEGYIAKVNQLEIAGHCYSAVEAVNFINQTKVDVLFLDINMPELSGIEMLETLSYSPKVILTTAYSEFALEGFEQGVVDYLMKPIRFSRFLKAVNRIITLPKGNADKDIVSNKVNFIEVKDGSLKTKIRYDDIQYIQAYGNYLKVFTKEKMYMISDTMKKYETILPNAVFIRIHKSYLINKNKIEKMLRNKIIINSKELPVGNSYKRVIELFL